MSSMSGAAFLWAVKGTGAIAGSAISLVYILPKGRREAAARFAVGLVSGLVFGGTVGLKVAVELGIEDRLGAGELALMGSAAASLSAWWALGFLMRLLTRRRSPGERTLRDAERTIDDL